MEESAIQAVGGVMFIDRTLAVIWMEVGKMLKSGGYEKPNDFRNALTVSNPNTLTMARKIIDRAKSEIGLSQLVLHQEGLSFRKINITGKVVTLGDTVSAHGIALR